MRGRFSLPSTLFPLVLAGFLAGMTYWLELASRPLVVDKEGQSRHDPDYIVEKFEARRFDPEGALQHTLRANIMQHYPDNDTTVILAPQLFYHRQPNTVVSAREAQLDSKGKHVTLVDDVRVTRSGQNGRSDTVLTTMRLDVIPDDETAWSNVPVTIHQGKSSINGSGLQANHKTAIYILEGPVQGMFHKGVGGDKRLTNSPSASIRPTSKSRPKPTSKPKT